MWAVFPPGISIGTVATKSVLEEAVVKSRPPRDVNPNILAAGVCVGRSGRSGPIHSPPPHPHMCTLILHLKQEKKKHHRRNTAVQEPRSPCLF